MNTALILYAFSAGMVATVNPCGLAMLPAYASFYLSAHSDRLTARALLPHLGRTLLLGGTLAAGLILPFALVGTVISLGAYFLVQVMPWIGLAIGVGLVLLGGWLLLGRHPTLPGLPLPPLRPERSGRNAFLFGAVYGLASLSCTLPIFLVVVGSVFASGGVIPGVVQFLTYGLGMGVVMVTLTLGLAFFEEVLVDYLRRLIPYVERASAILLLGAGAYIIYFWLVRGQLL